MINYGAAPPADEVELIVFGPGYGESIAVHVGDNNWLLVDSCFDAAKKRPASLDYLERIGVSFDRVKVIVATHWHDDHVKGLAEIVKCCTSATLQVSSVFNDREALAFLSAYGGATAAVHTRGAKELHEAIRSSNDAAYASQRTILWEDTIQGRKMRAVAFSPTPQAVVQFIARVSSFLPDNPDPINHAPELKPNLETVVISIDLGSDGILLGSDLENHDEHGWSAVIGNEWCLTKNQKASAYKVSHHGSATGDHPRIWGDLLLMDPMSVLTPFMNGSVKLPKDTDRSRIVANSAQAYISSNGTMKSKLNPSLLKQMGQVGSNIVPLEGGFGAVRFRKKLGAQKWNVELFGQAQEMK